MFIFISFLELKFVLISLSMCHYSIGPLSNFFSKFLQGYFGLCHVSEIFYYLKHCSCVRVRAIIGSHRNFSETLIPLHNSISRIKHNKKIKKWRTPIFINKNFFFSSNFLSFLSFKSEPHTHNFSFGFKQQHNTQTVPDSKTTQTVPNLKIAHK